MSLLKWKEMAERKSKIGRDVNIIRETLKQKKISDTMSDVEAEKLFKPITRGLVQLQPKPQPQPQQPLKRQIPDYSIDDDGIPALDLLDEGVQPQSTKQLVPTPRKSVKQMIEDLEAGKKKLTTVPEYYLGDPPEYGEYGEDEDPYEDPPEYAEDEIPDYEMTEEDRINETLDELKLANYEDIEMQLRRDDITEKGRYSYLSKKIEAADLKRRKFPGYKTQVTKQLNKGLITQAEAHERRTELDDARKVLNDYINYHRGKLKSIKGSGLKRGTKSVDFLNPKEALKKLELIVGSIGAGNNSIELRNTGVAILDILARHYIINKSQYNKIYKNFFL